MTLNDLAIVQLVHRVGTDDDQSLGTKLPDHRGVAPQGVGGSLVPAAALVPLMRMQDEEATGRSIEVPGPTVGKVIGQRAGVELLDHPHVGDARAKAVRQRKVDQPIHPAEGDRGLGPIVGE